MRKIMLAALLLAATPCWAAAPAVLTVTQSRSIAEDIAARVEKVYVFPEKRAAIAAKLRAAEAAGRYDVTDPGDLAQRLSKDMGDASHDRHMYIDWNPAESEGLKTADPGAETGAYYDAVAARTNQGLVEQRILPGNIRYVHWNAVEWSKAATPQAMADTARFLSNADAIILDLRDNGGGSADAVQNFISYFMPPKDQVLMTFHDGVDGTAQSTHVLTTLSGPRLTGKPFYVLISGHTGSAAEEFTYHVQQFKLGTLVGQHTAGAANNDTLYPIAPGFVLSISTGRPVHPVSGTNWEGTGVLPDVEVASDDALAKAQSLALADRIAHGGADNKADYEWALVGVNAQLAPPHLSAAALGEYAGQYGVRRLWMENGVLKFQREDHEPTTLTPLAADLFAFGNDPDTRAKFRRTNGKITGFDMIRSDATSTPVNRGP